MQDKMVHVLKHCKLQGFSTLSHSSFEKDGRRSTLYFDCKNGTEKSPEQLSPGFPYTWENHVFGQGNFLVFFGTFYFSPGLNAGLICGDS